MIFPGFPGVLSFFQVFQVEWEPWETPPTETETPLPCGQTDTCENITLAQTSFAGGN